MFFFNSATASGASLTHKFSHDVFPKLVNPHHHHHNHLLEAKRDRSFWSNPSSDIISYGTKLHFTVNVTNLESDCFESNLFTLNKVYWKVKFCKVSAKADNRVEDALDGYLIYSFSEFDVDWLCDALAVFELAITNDKIDGKIVKKLKDKFNNEAPEHSVELIDWSALMANCVHDGQFSVDVEVFVSPKRNTAIDMTRVAGDFRVVVEDISEMGQTVSPNVHLQGVGWEVAINIDEDKVGVLLQLSKSDDSNSDLNVNEWSWNVTTSISLLPIKTDAHPIYHQFTHSFYLVESVGFPNFVSYKNFTKSYVRNDKAVFVVNLRVDPPQPLWKIDDEMDNLNKLF